MDKIWSEYDKLVRELTERIISAGQILLETILYNWFVTLQKDE